VGALMRCFCGSVSPVDKEERTLDGGSAEETDSLLGDLFKLGGRSGEFE
jgi:hypothetical protein